MVGAQKQFDLLALAAILCELLRSISRVEACPTLAQIRAQRESGEGTQKRRRGPGIHLHGLHPFGTPVYVVAKVRFAVRALRRRMSGPGSCLRFLRLLEEALGGLLVRGTTSFAPFPIPVRPRLQPSDVQVLAAAWESLVALPKSS